MRALYCLQSSETQINIHSAKAGTCPSSTLYLYFSNILEITLPDSVLDLDVVFKITHLSILSNAIQDQDHNLIHRYRTSLLSYSSPQN